MFAVNKPDEISHTHVQKWKSILLSFDHIATNSIMSLFFSKFANITFKTTKRELVQATN